MEITRDNVWIILAIVGVILLPNLYKAIRHRGFKGAMFGAPLVREIAELELSAGRLTRTTLRIHVLDPADRGDGPHVGIEVVRSTFASWETSPISLTRTEARQLAEQLSRAVETSDSKTVG